MVEQVIPFLQNGNLPLQGAKRMGLCPAVCGRLPNRGAAPVLRTRRVAEAASVWMQLCCQSVFRVTPSRGFRGISSPPEAAPVFHVPLISFPLL